MIRALLETLSSAAVDVQASEPVLGAVAVLGALAGYGIFQRRSGRPFARAFTVSGAQDAARIGCAARLAIEKHVRRRPGRLTDPARREVEAFYVRWLNLAGR